MENPAPQVYSTLTVADGLVGWSAHDINRGPNDVSTIEVFDLIRHLRDPEHPTLSLEQLRVVKIEDVVLEIGGTGPSCDVLVKFTPTVPTCSVATVIGLAIIAKLSFCLPSYCNIRVSIAQGTHDQETSVNKQLADKERVSAALENPNLMRMIKRSVKNADRLPAKMQLFG